MTSCCRGGPCEQMFSPRSARRSLQRYRSKGLDAIERAMVDAAVRGGIEDARVLDLGGGIGTLQAELLGAGAATGEVIEVVAAYEPFAKELVSEKGLRERSTFRLADALADPGGIEAADVVVLNRVVCCSPEGVELAAAAARLARRTLLLSYPRDAAWIRLAVGAINIVQRMLRRSFRVFVHPPAALRAAATAQGLRVEEEGRNSFWEYAALRRA